MTREHLDIQLCRDLWGDNFAEHPDYVAAVAAMEGGRPAFAINADLRDRLEYVRSEHGSRLDERKAAWGGW